MALRGDRPPVGLAWVVTWPLSAVLAATVFLSAQHLNAPFRGAEPTPAPLTTSAWNAQLPGRIGAIDRALRTGPLRLAAPIEEERGSGPLRFKHRLYEIQLGRADQARADAAVAAVDGVDPGLVIATAPGAEQSEVRFGLDGLLVATLRVLWRESPEARPQLTIVVAPLGEDLRLARHIVESVDAPLVLGIAPQRPFAAQVAELGKMFDRESVLVFEAPPPPPPPPPTPSDPLTPMPTVRRPRPPAPPDVPDGLTKVPDAVGVAWVGAAPTPPRADRALLAAVDQRQLRFLGDRGDKSPAPLPVPRQVIEDPRRPEGVGEQLEKAADAARQHGRAIAIGPPSEAMLSALRTLLPAWRQARLEIVPLSAMAAAAPAATATPTPRLSRR
jgi:hypothetical protein